MNIYFYFKNMKVSDGLQKFARERISERIDNLCPKNCRMNVTFEVAPHEKTVHIDFFSGYGRHMFATASGDDVRGAAGEAIDRIVVQINKRKDHNQAQRHKLIAKPIEVKESIEFEEDWDGDVLRFESNDHIMMA